MPFVILFIARISKGRTVRQFVFAVMGVPTLVICHLVETPDVATRQVLWGMTLAVVTCALIWVGDVAALQAASIIIGLPLAGVTLLVGAGLIKALLAGEL